MSTLKELLKEGVNKVRNTNWASKTNYVEYTMHDGALTPWCKLYDDMNEEVNGRNPVEMLTFQPSNHLDDPSDNWELYNEATHD
jgi:hypothetical protein